MDNGNGANAYDVRKAEVEAHTIQLEIEKGREIDMARVAVKKKQLDHDNYFRTEQLALDKARLALATQVVDTQCKALTKLMESNCSSEDLCIATAFLPLSLKNRLPDELAGSVGKLLESMISNKTTSGRRGTM